jgi:hypothetical protein
VGGSPSATSFEWLAENSLGCPVNKNCRSPSKRMRSLVVCVLAVLVCAAVADTCGGNCPSNDCPSCPCGTSTSYVSIDSWCGSFSGWNQACCRFIVQHESSGNAHAVNHNSNGSFDVGVWQINSVNWNDCNGGRAPCDPSSNLQCATQVWRWGGNSFRLWSTCGECGCC